MKKLTIALVILISTISNSLHSQIIDNEGNNYTILADPSPFKTCNMLYRHNDFLIIVKTSITATTSYSTLPLPPMLPLHLPQLPPLFPLMS